MSQVDSDYTSLVPKYTFADSLEEQERQLSENPLLRRMNEARKKMDSDPHRPIYHYVNPESTLNDPNGLCYWQGRWHLFYQAYPPEDSRQHWGHAVSDDLVHWRDLPYAIYPNPERACFSGSALVEKDRVIAMYHGTDVGNMVAVSNDPLLLNWEKVTGKAVIPYPPELENAAYSVFDPCIWKKNEYYYSLSGGTLPNGPGGRDVRANWLFRSKDLANWEFLHPFVEDDHYSMVGDDGACPYFWPIGDRHMLLFFSHTSGGQYLLGDYDTERDKFVVTNHAKCNFGASIPSGVHAPSAAPDGKGGIVVIFNMNKGLPANGWDQIMTLPRRLTLAGGDGSDEVNIEPAGDVESLRYDHQSIDPMVLPANEEVVIESVRGNAIELEVEIDPQGAPVIELNVLRSSGGEEVTRIGFFHERGFRRVDRRSPNSTSSAVSRKSAVRVESLITIDSSRSSSLPDVTPRPPETAPVYLKKGEPLRLRVFVDRSVVEVFVNGKQCVAVRVYPTREDSVGVALRSQGRNAELKSLDAWKMQNIYQEG